MEKENDNNRFASNRSFIWFIMFTNSHIEKEYFMILLWLFGCSPQHFNTEIENRKILVCISMKADGDCNEETL